MKHCPAINDFCKRGDCYDGPACIIQMQHDPTSYTNANDELENLKAENYLATKFLENLIAKVTRMRNSQKDYFARRQETDKKLSMGFETDVDTYIKLLRRNGFDPPELSKQPDQGKIF